MMKVLLILVFSVSLVGCASTENYSKEDQGTAVGAALGAAIGAIAAKGGNTGLGVVLGGIVGAIIGNRIGHNLDEKDSEALAAKTVEALGTTEVGETVTWESDHSGASAEITTVSEQTKIVEFEVEPEVFERYRYTSVNLNVRSGPGTDNHIVDSLSKNSLVKLEGEASNGWYKVSKNGKILGYAYGTYLVKSSTETLKRTTAKNEESQIAKSSVQEKSKSAEQIVSEERIVIAEVNCKTIRVRTKVDGRVEESMVETCMDPSGSWGA